MKVFGMFFGGSSYAMPDVTSRDDVEEFASIQDAENTLINRKGDPYYPCVTREPPKDGGMYMYVFKTDPYNNGDPYPDYILEFNQWGRLIRRKA